MALKGNLRDFTIIQILNLIHLAHKTGTLIIERPSEAIWLFFRDGKLAYAQAGQEDNSMANILYKHRKLTGSQHRVIKENAPDMSDKELGLHLINGNYISQQDILSSFQAHFIGILNRLFTWSDGLFRFESELKPPDGKITVRIGLENIILEGSRRAREWEHLQDEIPSLEVALKFVDRPGTNIRKLNLSINEWQVLSFINPKNTLHQIARATQLNEMEIRRVVFGLLQAGLVEMTRPVGARSTGKLPTAQPRSQLPAPKSKKSKEEQKSLINRIIARIRAL